MTALLNRLRAFLAERAERVITLTWLFQFMLFGGGGLLFLLGPRMALGFLRMGGTAGFQTQNAGPEADLSQCAAPAMELAETFLWSWSCDPGLVVGEVRFIGVYLAMAALFSGLGLMFTSVRFRRGLAVTLGTFFAFWTVTFINSYLSGRYGPFAMVVWGVPAFVTTALNGVYVFAVREPLEEAREAIEVEGSEDSRPPWLSLVWGLQGVLFLALGTFRLFWPGHYLRFWLGQDAYDGIQPFVGLAADPIGVIASYTLGLGMMSFLALKSVRAWEWRTFARLFAVCELTLLVVAFVNVVAGFGTVLRSFPAWVGGVFMVVNLVAAWERREWVTDDARSDPQGWTFMDLVVGPLMWLQMLQQKRRSSHLVGVGLSGTAVIHAGEVPQNELFNGSGREVQVTLRFANLSLLDDRGLDVRGVGLRLREDDEPLLDLLMNTGVMCPAPNLVSFALFVAGKWLPQSLRKRGLESNRTQREDAQAGLRYAPDSYAGLRYHSQKVTHWIAGDGTLHCVRYRLIPEGLADDAEEDGIPSDDILDEAWKRSPRSAVLNRLPRSDYLRQELRERVAREPVRLTLQAQVHRPEPGEGTACYDASVEWPTRWRPWKDLATITLDEALPDEVTERLRFQPKHRPASLPIPQADSPLDPRSLAYSEARVVQRLGRLREHMIERSGLPTFGEVVK